MSQWLLEWATFQSKYSGTIMSVYEKENAKLEKMLENQDNDLRRQVMSLDKLKVVNVKEWTKRVEKIYAQGDKQLAEFEDQQKELALSLRYAYEDGADVALAIGYLWEKDERDNKSMLVLKAGKKEAMQTTISPIIVPMADIIDSNVTVEDCPLFVCDEKVVQLITHVPFSLDEYVHCEQEEQKIMEWCENLMTSADIEKYIEYDAREIKEPVMPYRVFPQSMEMNRKGRGNGYVSLTQYTLKDLKDFYPKGYNFQLIRPLGVEFHLEITKSNDGDIRLIVRFDEGAVREDVTHNLDYDGSRKYTMVQVRDFKRLWIEPTHWSNGGYLLDGIDIETTPDVKWKISWSLTLECIEPRRANEEVEFGLELMEVEDMSKEVVNNMDLRTLASFACTSVANKEWCEFYLCNKGSMYRYTGNDPLMCVLLEQYQNVTHNWIKCDGLVCQRSIGSRVYNCHLCDLEEKDIGVDKVREVRTLLKTMMEMYGQWDQNENMNCTSVEDATMMLIPAKEKMSLMEEVHFASIGLRHINVQDQDVMLFWMKYCHKVMVKIDKKNENADRARALGMKVDTSLPYEDDDWFEGLMKWKSVHVGSQWSDRVYFSKGLS